MGDGWSHDDFAQGGSSAEREEFFSGDRHVVNGKSRFEQVGLSHRLSTI